MKKLTFLAFLLLAACTAPSLNNEEQSSSAISSSSSLVSSMSDVPGIDATGLGLTVPSNMKIEIFAKNLPNARVMVRDNFGNIWVSRTKSGIVTLLEIGSGGQVTNQMDIFKGLRNPHGLAIAPSSVGSGSVLYIAEETAIKKALLYSDAPVETIATLPAGGRHFTRTIGFGPDGRLYVSIGSTCDACIEQDQKHGTIMSMNPDGSDQKIIASGLRNAVFFDWSDVSGKMFATEMGRDTLGDVTPPDEIDVITEGAHYGWPFCYGDRIHDPHFPNDFVCNTTVPPHIALPAHVAPLGLAFVPEEGWPESQWYDLIVAEHGSWNSSEKVGYKLIRIPLDAEGNPDGQPEDFVTGWLTPSSVSGRPVGLMIEPGGTLYISDDQKGVIYKLSRTTPAQ
jgi:glucose/arabinose dehydrogenase